MIKLLYKADLHNMCVFCLGICLNKLHVKNNIKLHIYTFMVYFKKTRLLPNLYILE